MKASRVPAAWVLGIALALAAAAPALAADPTLPPDVVLDTSVTISFVVDGVPIDEAEVELTASRDGVILATATAQTDPSGSATITGLPRSTAGAPVLMDIAAHRNDPRVEHDNGCWEAETWYGTATNVVSDVNVQVQLTSGHSSVAFCPPPSSVPPAAVTEAPGTSAGPELTLPPTDVASGPVTPGSWPVGPGLLLIGAIGGAFLLLGLRRAAG